MDSIDIINEGFNRPSVIIDENKLSLDYLPQNLPFRGDHLRSIAQYFRGVLKGDLASNRVILAGPVGVGKTSIAKKFGQWLSHNSNKFGGGVPRYVHINCRRAKTPFMILLSIVKELQGKVANRGYAADELLEMILEILEDQEITLILVLDEVDFIIPKGGVDLLYALTRTTDDRHANRHHIGLVLIARSTQFLSYLDQSTISSLTAPVIEVPPYSSSELQVILQDRIKECFTPGSVTDDSVRLIADIAEDRGGDARHALELLLIAGKHADLDGSLVVYPDHVRKAKSKVDPSLLKEVLSDLSYHKLLLLLAISRTLRQTKKAYLTTGVAEKAYHMIAEEEGIIPRKHTQVWEYLQEMELLGIISLERSGKGQRGNTSNISILDLSLIDLEKEVIPRLQNLRE